MPINIIKKYMEKNDITGYQIAKVTNISQPTIDRAANKDLNNLSFKNLRAIAKALKKPVGEVAEELDKMERDLDTMVEEAMDKAQNLISLINEKQSVSKDDLYQIHGILDFDEYSKMNGSKMDDDEESIIDIEALNEINEDSQYILLISTPEFYEDENGQYHNVYKAVDLQRSRAFLASKEFITSNAYGYLYDLSVTFDFYDENDD